VSESAEWEPILGFRSPGEFARFKSWIDARVSDGSAKRAPVRVPWAGSNVIVEEWFECPGGGVWRLIEPDPPSAGLFDRVNPDRPEGR